MRTRPRDRWGYTRPVPLMLGVRVRLAPVWAWKQRRPLLQAAFVVGVAVAVCVGLVILVFRPGPAACYHTGIGRAIVPRSC